MALFWYWAHLRPGVLRQLIAFGAMAACVMVLLATGSRSGILGLGILGVLLQTGPRAYRSGSGRAGRRRTHGSYARRANTPFVPLIGESQLIDVSTIEAGRITRLEVFALDDRATAMARFAALRRDVGNSGRDLRRARA